MKDSNYYPVLLNYAFNERDFLKGYRKTMR
jgi:hypothetical protein